MANITTNADTFQELLNERTMKIKGSGRMKEIEERKYKDGTGIKLMTVDSAIADVNIVASNSSKIEAHLYGRLDEEDDVEFEIDTVNVFEVRIRLKFTGCCYYSKLKLDITVPHKMFRVINVKSLSADITLDKEISAEFLKVRTKFGSVEVIAKLAEMDITTTSGDVELCIDATKNIKIKVTTTTGDVSMEFHNIGSINLSEKTKKRAVKNRHKGGVGHTAYVDVSTLCGDVRIR